MLAIKTSYAQSASTFEELGVRRSEIKTGDGLLYPDFIRTLKPNYSKVWRDISAGHFALWFSLGAVMFAQTVFYSTNVFLGILSIAIGGVAIGAALNYITLFLHEAAHFNLAADKATNDSLSNVFIGPLTGADVRIYRLTHFEHHRALGTEYDTEISYQSALNTQFLIESLLGIKVFKIILHRRSRLAVTSPSTTAAKAPSWVGKGALCIHAAAVLMPLVFGFWWASLSWMMGVGAIFPFLCAVRQLLEHRPEQNSNQGAPVGTFAATTRNFKSSIFCHVFGGAGFAHHLIHHLEPQISYTCLADLEKFLMKTQIKPLLVERTTTYSAAFQQLFELG